MRRSSVLRSRRNFLPAALLAACFACCAPRPIANCARLRVLGTAQDGGLPHIACTCPQCEAARRDPGHQRYISSLALLLPNEQGRTRVYLIDASPDIREQLELLRDVRERPAGRVDRMPVDGVFLTHAHIGHYLGLAFFGFEAAHTQGLPVYCTPRMADFLKTNGPWSQLVRIGNVALHETPPGASVELPTGGGADVVTVTPIRVPHRDEYSDTVGYLFRRSGPATPRGSTVFYVPDTEPWRTWSPSLLEIIERQGVGTLLVDGTFFSADELPGRPASSIGHPLMTDTMALLEPLVRAGRLRVFFTHLNHSNPAVDPRSPAGRAVVARGFRVAGDRDELAF